jgi:hypothetical protein
VSNVIKGSKQTNNNGIILNGIRAVLNVNKDSGLCGNSGDPSCSTVSVSNEDKFMDAAGINCSYFGIMVYLTLEIMVFQHLRIKSNTMSSFFKLLS